MSFDYNYDPYGADVSSRLAALEAETAAKQEQAAAEEINAMLEGLGVTTQQEAQLVVGHALALPTLADGSPDFQRAYEITQDTLEAQLEAAHAMGPEFEPELPADASRSDRAEWMTARATQQDRDAEGWAAAERLRDETPNLDDRQERQQHMADRLLVEGPHPDGGDA